MNAPNKSLSCDEAKEIDLVDFLTSLNHQPVKIRNSDCWYLSPFRVENTASFKVNRKGNVWFDHGEGIGGTIIDFGIRYFNCSIPDFLEKLNNNLPFHQPSHSTLPDSSFSKTENSIEIISVQDIQSLELLHYLSHRKIALDVAKKYCRQVVYNLNNKNQQALCFKNDKDGYELRSPSFKGSSAPKTVTTIQNVGREVFAFEGFFDFLSYLTLYHSQPPANVDYLILNSTAFLEKSRPIMDGFDQVRLYLDHDQTGRNCTLKALSWNSRYKDYSGLYAGHKDLNEWLMKIGSRRKQSVRQRP